MEAKEHPRSRLSDYKMINKIGVQASVSHLDSLSTSNIMNKQEADIVYVDI